jgi:hypothetical protein
MQIILSAQDIKDAVLASVSKTIGLTGKHVEISFTSGRSRNDLTANIVIGEKPAAAAVASEVPAFNDDVEPEQAKAEQTLADPVQEAEAHTPATTGSLFKAVQ